MTRYRTPARVLHWITAVLVLTTIPAGLLMVRDDAPFGDALFLYHKNVGVVILTLVALRLVWRAVSPPPPLHIPMAGLARATHWAMYATLIVIGVSGYVRVTAGGFPLEIVDMLGLPRMAADSQLADTAKRIHWAAHYVIIGLVALHIAAALRHAWRRDGVMGRML